jgi:glycosyltransferase involved in cell wall biosynthesis
VITATYNRGNVLRYTIASLLRSTFTDWELLVIGDACTDDTEELVASFRDHRIHFTNLRLNHGEQSGPNNEGLRQAQGRYLAFLNHDDLWMPNHLETTVQGIEQTDADLVYSLAIAISHDGKPRLIGGTHSGYYEPQIHVPASQWLFRRQLVEEIGPWRSAHEIYAVPSQEWIFRAWRAKKKLCMLAQVTVIEIPSGGRQQVYLRREHLENQYYYEQMVENPAFLEQMLTRIATDSSAQLTDLAILPSARQIVRSLILRTGLVFNLSPAGVHHLIRFRGKGGFINHLRKKRGLPELGRGGQHG